MNVGCCARLLSGHHKVRNRGESFTDGGACWVLFLKCICLICNIYASHRINYHIVLGKRGRTTARAHDSHLHHHHISLSLLRSSFAISRFCHSKMYSPHFAPEGFIDAMDRTHKHLFTHTHTFVSVYWCTVD